MKFLILFFANFFMNESDCREKQGFFGRVLQYTVRKCKFALHIDAFLARVKAANNLFCSLPTGFSFRCYASCSRFCRFSTGSNVRGLFCTRALSHCRWKISNSRFCVSTIILIGDKRTNGRAMLAPTGA